MYFNKPIFSDKPNKVESMEMACEAAKIKQEFKQVYTLRDKYFPYVDRDDIVDSPLNGPHRPNYAYQRWTKIQERAGESSAIYYRFFSNGTWDAFKKSSY